MSSKTFPARLDALHDMLEFIRSGSEEVGFTNPAIDKIILASEEALVNIINYSYPSHSGGIEITCKQTTGQPGIQILLKDDGVPFNPLEESTIKANPKPPRPSVDHSRLGGYGIYIFMEIMDQVDYNRLNGGNLLSLTKYINEIV